MSLVLCSQREAVQEEGEAHDLEEQTTCRGHIAIQVALVMGGGRDLRYDIRVKACRSGRETAGVYCAQHADFLVVSHRDVSLSSVPERLSGSMFADIDWLDDSCA